MRNAEFDKEAVLRAAMIAFMDKGYTKTSMQDLKIATGLHPGSIYCAFENKRGLLLAALGQYRADRVEEFQHFFSGQVPALEALKTYLDHIVQECISCEAAQACLLTKALNELAEQDDEVQSILIDHLSDWQASVADIFQQAITNKELTGERSAEQLARFFIMGIYGLRTYAQTHPEADIMHELATQLFTDLCL
ncbi:TetR/AcrR family transcriptional regulator [Colwellia sp. Arc7-635]|uniref:TetR/AcrR family transcriptional regulator n=1 Tax=Colwellia sp. Arc7-635 TaxID=2497879 RepID=UPI000F85B551|nr:TetR/AcrR family transcriptional regulator [Colwellia sp. Arc7-635]AZQ83966.1 TetR/AcrR family transcriptional regulator [Colwellia sp. Arc7-635]